MYKLHYDVGAGKQFNVSYKGIEFEVQAGSGEVVEVEINKAVTISENGTVEITPSSGKDAMAKVTAAVNVPVPSVEMGKYVTLTTNWTDNLITASSGYDVMGAVNVHVDVPTETKEFSITENGHYDIEPSDGYQVMDGVSVDVNVPTSSVDVESNKTVTITQNGVVEITPSIDKDAMAKVTATVNVPPPLQDAIWYSTLFSQTLMAVPNAKYMYTGTSPIQVTISADSTQSTQGARLDVYGDNVTCVLPANTYNGGFGLMYLPNVSLTSLQYHVSPVYRLIVYRSLVLSRRVEFGSADPNSPCRIDVYGSFDMSSNILNLRNCSLYLYTNDIQNVGLIRDYSSTETGEVHVLTTFSGGRLGGHNVIKDLTPPTN